jgi:hypothetical protein
MATAVSPQILAVFADLEHIWQSRDFGRMRAHWLKDLPAPLYLAEEKQTFLTTWPAFDAYFAATGAGSRSSLVKYKPLHSTAVGDGQEMVAFTLEWTVQLVNEDMPIGGSVRGVALFAREADAWKMRAYIEAPLAPIIYMRELYELVAESRGVKPVP